MITVVAKMMIVYQGGVLAISFVGASTEVYTPFGPIYVMGDAPAISKPQSLYSQ